MKPNKIKKNIINLEEIKIKIVAPKNIENKNTKNIIKGAT
jgi:hypothetical protein